MLSIRLRGFYNLKKPSRFISNNWFLLITVLICGVVVLDSSSHSEPLNYKSAISAKRQLKEFIAHIIQAPYFLEPKTHADFWKLIKELGLSEEELEQSRYIITGYATEYNRLFFTDALQSLKENKPYKSLERFKYEKKALKDETINKSIISRNDEYIKKISKKEPIDYFGEPVVFDEELINTTLSNIYESTFRLDVLFTNPKKVKFEGSLAYLKWDGVKAKKILPSLLAAWNRSSEDPILNANLG